MSTNRKGNNCLSKSPSSLHDALCKKAAYVRTTVDICRKFLFFFFLQEKALEDSEEVSYYTNNVKLATLKTQVAALARI